MLWWCPTTGPKDRETEIIRCTMVKWSSSFGWKTVNINCYIFLYIHVFRKRIHNINNWGSHRQYVDLYFFLLWSVIIVNVKNCRAMCKIKKKIKLKLIKKEQLTFSCLCLSWTAAVSSQWAPVPSVSQLPSFFCWTHSSPPPALASSPPDSSFHPGAAASAAQTSHEAAKIMTTGEWRGHCTW